jgi:hypothetical protein
MAQRKADGRRNSGSISRPSNAVMGHFGQIPSGRWNGFHLERKSAWKGNQPSRREFPSDMFAFQRLEGAINRS